ncbi:MAG: LysM domain-containing protein [Anaerolineae bacterium]|nr:LysM domain-containing protein [Anaerolineae bacterium]
MAQTRFWLLWVLSICSLMGQWALTACVPVTPAVPSVDTPASTAATPPTPFFYEVQPGDTLWLIARRFNMDMETLIQVNELKNPDLLQPGQRLLISDRITISGRLLPTATPTPLRCVNGCEKPPPGCEIKAVIARLDGTRLYLLPEDPLYPWRAADLWFCREEDAQRAGWRRWTPYGPRLSEDE